MNLQQAPTQERLQHWFKASTNELDTLFRQVHTITKENFGRKITIFAPGSKFPAISITGNRCQLQCQHCCGHFLEHMHAITRPTDLLTFCQKLDEKGGVGCLISGGCNSSGQVPLKPFLPAFSQIKQKTNLFLNIHTGFLTQTEASQLAQVGIDCASVDIIGDENTLHQIYGLSNRSLQDYSTTLEALAYSKIMVAPHVCVGLHHGELVGELKALQLIHSTLNPAVIVIIAFMPTQGTPMAKSPPPKSIDIARVCALARILFPFTEIALGCMRPRGAKRREMEQLAIEAGVTKLVLPTKSTIEYLQENQYEIQTEAACCVLPICD